jgi:serine/threonine protein kinase
MFREAQSYSTIDLKMDNILVGFEHPSVIENFVQKQARYPMPRKYNNGRSIYLSHNDFGPPKSFRMLPRIADFGLAQSGDGSEPLLHPIQPPLYHAPEVLLGTSWTYSADIWNLGILVCSTTTYIRYCSHAVLSLDLEYDGR